MSTSKTRQRFTRRSLFVGTGTGAASLAAGAFALAGRPGAECSVAVAPPVPPPVAAASSVAGAPVLALVHPLAPGLRVGAFTLTAVHDLHLGAIPLVLTGPAGASVQVDVLRFNPAGANGVAHARGLTLTLANRGDGRTQTREQHGLVAMALAALVGQGSGVLELPAELVTIAERGRRFPDGCFAVCA